MFCTFYIRYTRFTGTFSPLDPVDLYTFDHRFNIDNLFRMVKWHLHSISQLIHFTSFAVCWFHSNLLSKWNRRYITTSVCAIITWLILTEGQYPFRRADVISVNVNSITLIFDLWCQSSRTIKYYVVLLVLMLDLILDIILAEYSTWIDLGVDFDNRGRCQISS